MGRLSRRLRISRPVIHVKLVFALRSLREDHDPLPGASATPARAFPFPSSALTNRVPPVARTLNSFAAEEAKSASVASAQTKLPRSLALARWPAAKLRSPPARFIDPPGMVALSAPNAMALFSPPPTVDALEVAETKLNTPPAMVEKGESKTIIF